MPIDHWIDAAAETVHARVTGTFTLQDMKDVIDATLANPAFRPGFGILSDHRSVEAAATPDQVHGFLAHLAARGAILSQSRWAVVAERPASIGMMRMMAALAAVRVPMRIEVFATVEAATRWLAAGRRE